MEMLGRILGTIVGFVVWMTIGLGLVFGVGMSIGVGVAIGAVPAWLTWYAIRYAFKRYGSKDLREDSEKQSGITSQGKCSDCGNLVPSYAEHCPKCGASLK